MEAIILAGGLGTRLSHILADVPKPMADVNGEPFLTYIFEYVLKNRIEHVVLAVGYKAEFIKDYFKDEYKGIKITYSFEDIITRF
jgi:D-glycero-alpha-D-manno-heptose 1-phosphate guanylyltransferase